MIASAMGYTSNCRRCQGRVMKPDKVIAREARMLASVSHPNIDEDVD